MNVRRGVVINKPLSRSLTLQFISICSLALLTSQAGIFVDWGADRGSVVLTVVVVWISDILLAEKGPSSNVEA